MTATGFDICDLVIWRSARSHRARRSFCRELGWPGSPCHVCRQGHFLSLFGGAGLVNVCGIEEINSGGDARVTIVVAVC